MKLKSTLVLTGLLTMFSLAVTQTASAEQPARKAPAGQHALKRRVPGKWSVLLRRAAVELNKSVEAQRAARAAAARTEPERAAPNSRFRRG